MMTYKLLGVTDCKCIVFEFQLIANAAAKNIVSTKGTNKVTKALLKQLV